MASSKNEDLPDLDEKYICREIYSACDPEGTNEVHTSKLIEYVSPFFKNNLTSLESLKLTLDPQDKNFLISFDTFLEKWVLWVLKFKNDIGGNKEETLQELNDAFNSFNINHSTPRVPKVGPIRGFMLLEDFENDNNEISKQEQDDVQENGSIVMPQTTDESNTIARFVFERDQLANENDILKQQVVTIEEKVTKLEGDFLRVRRRLDSEETVNELLKKEIDELKDENVKFENQIKTFAKNLQECESDKTYAEKAYEQLETENSQLSQHHKKLEKDMSELRSLIECRDQELLDALKLNNELEAKLSHEICVNNELRDENEFLNHEKTTLERRLSTACGPSPLLTIPMRDESSCVPIFALGRQRNPATRSRFSYPLTALKEEKPAERNLNHSLPAQLNDSFTFARKRSFSVSSAQLRRELEQSLTMSAESLNRSSSVQYPLVSLQDELTEARLGTLLESGDTEKVRELEQELDKVKSEAEALRRQCQDLKKERDEKAEEVKSVSQHSMKQCEKFKNRCEVWISQSKSYRKEIEDLQHECEGLKNICGNLKSESEAFRKQSEDLKNECEYLKSESEHFRKANENSRNECDDLKNICGNFKNESENIRKQSENMKNEYESLKSKYKDLKCESEAFRKQSEDLKNKCEGLKSESEAFRKQSEDSKNECEDLKNKCENLRSESEAFRKQSEDLRNECERLKSESEALRNKCLDLEKELFGGKSKRGPIKISPTNSTKTMNVTYGRNQIAISKLEQKIETLEFQLMNVTSNYEGRVESIERDWKEKYDAVNELLNVEKSKNKKALEELSNNESAIANLNDFKRQLNQVLIQFEEMSTMVLTNSPRPEADNFGLRRRRSRRRTEEGCGDASCRNSSSTSFFSDLRAPLDFQIDDELPTNLSESLLSVYDDSPMETATLEIFLENPSSDISLVREMVNDRFATQMQRCQEEYKTFLRSLKDISTLLRQHKCIGASDDTNGVFVLLEEVRSRVKDVATAVGQLGALTGERRTLGFWEFSRDRMETIRNSERKELVDACTDPEDFVESPENPTVELRNSNRGCMWYISTMGCMMLSIFLTFLVCRSIFSEIDCGEMIVTNFFGHVHADESPE